MGGEAGEHAGEAVVDLDIKARRGGVHEVVGSGGEPPEWGRVEGRIVADKGLALNKPMHIHIFFYVLLHIQIAMLEGRLF